LSFSLDRINATTYCFYMLSFIQFYAKKSLLSILVLNMIFDCKEFASKLFAPDYEMFGSEI